jgi:hypothetical protein
LRDYKQHCTERKFHQQRLRLWTGIGPLLL